VRQRRHIEDENINLPCRVDIDVNLVERSDEESKSSECWDVNVGVINQSFVSMLEKSDFAKYEK